MKKMKAGKRSSVAPKNVDEYLAGVPEPARSTLNELRATIGSVLPCAATETISYGMPAFKHHRVLEWYALFSKHCSLFPTAAVFKSYKAELKGLATSKGTVQFPTDTPLPTALFMRLV